jgi:hypothetical protein
MKRKMNCKRSEETEDSNPGDHQVQDKEKPLLDETAAREMPKKKRSRRTKFLQVYSQLLSISMLLLFRSIHSK